jgi:hypothetical protein
MTIKTDRGRLVIEFEMRGKRVFRRLPAVATEKDAIEIEERMRREIFEARDLRLDRDPPPAPRRGSDQRWAAVAGLLLSAGPVRPAPGIYFLCKEGRLMYIGRSKNVAGRLAGHVGKEFDRICMIDAPGGDLKRTEEFLIRMLRPPLNRNGTGRKIPRGNRKVSYSGGTMDGAAMRLDAPGCTVLHYEK